MKAIPPWRPSAFLVSSTSRVSTKGSTAATPMATRPAVSAASLSSSMRPGAFTPPLSQVNRSTGAVAPLRGVASTPAMAKFGHQTRLSQHFERPIFVEVDDDSVAGLSGADERHDTVATGIGVLHDASVAIDGEGRGRCVHAPTMPVG